MPLTTSVIYFLNFESFLLIEKPTKTEKPAYTADRPRNELTDQPFGNHWIFAQYTVVVDGVLHSTVMQRRVVKIINRLAHGEPPNAPRFWPWPLRGPIKCYTRLESISPKRREKYIFIILARTTRKNDRLPISGVYRTNTHWIDDTEHYKPHGTYFIHYHSVFNLPTVIIRSARFATLDGSRYGNYFKSSVDMKRVDMSERRAECTSDRW